MHHGDIILILILAALSGYALYACIRRGGCADCGKCCTRGNSQACKPESGCCHQHRHSSPSCCHCRPGHTCGCDQGKPCSCDKEQH